MADRTNNQMNDLLGLNQSVLSGMGTSGTGGFMGGQRARPEPVDRFPALEQEPFLGKTQPVFDVKMEPMFGGKDSLISAGIEVPTEVKPRIADVRKISPEIKLQQVMNFDNPKIVSNFEKATGFRNAQGETTAFLESMDFATRLDVANRAGATIIVDDEGKDFKVPWDNLIYEQTRLPSPDQEISIVTPTGKTTLLSKATALITGTLPIPETEVRQVLAKDMTEEDMDLYREGAMATSLNLIDPEVGRPLFADLINKNLIKAGVEDARTRADMISMSLGTVGMGDIEKVVGGAAENIFKFPVQLGLWGIGETLDAIDGEYGNLNDDPGYFDIRESSRRRAIMDTIWQPLAHKMIARMAQRGTEVSLPVMESYLSTLTGLAPRLVKVGAEILAPSKVAKVATAFRSKKELERFKVYYNEEIAKGSTRSFDDIFQSYKTDRSGVLAGAEPSWLQKIKQGTVGNRVTLGMQVDDAAMEVGKRAEVVSAIKYRDNLIKRRDALNAGVSKRGGTPDALDRSKLDAFELDISRADAEVHAIKLKSATPKFMRDIDTANAYMVIGAGATGHFFQQRDETYGVTGDPMMGELVGLGAGLFLNLAQGNVPAALSALKRSSLGQKFGGKKAYLEFLTENITNFSPEMQAGIIRRAEYLDEIYDVLVAEGLDPKLLDTGFANLSGLATLKSLEDITRSKLSVKQIRKFDVQDLEENLNTQKRMVAELRGVLQSIEGGVGESPKGDFFRIINAAIEQGQNSIDQLGKDISTIDKHGVQYYLDLIEGNSQSFGNQLGPNTVRNFEQAMERLQNGNLINAADIPRLEFEQINNDSRARISDAVTKHANTVYSNLSTQAGASAVVENVIGAKGVVASGQRTAADIANFDGPGDLLAVLLESGHATDKAKVQRMYGVLDNGNYVDNAGNAIEGDVVVNVSDVFDAMFLEMPNLPIGKLRGSDMTVGQTKILDETFVTLSNPFFSALAEGSDKTILEVVKNMKASLEKRGKEFRKDVSDQTQVVQFMRELAQEGDSSLDIFEMSFGQLRELDKSLRHIQYASRKSGNTERASRFETLQNVVEGKFGQFEMVRDDGTRMDIGSLNVMNMNDAEELVPTPVAGPNGMLAQANREWAKFKSRWYDLDEKAVVPRWMSWGNRSVVDVSVNNPLGVRFGNGNPREWLDIKTVSNLDPNVGGKTFFDSLQRTLGQEIVTPSGTPAYAFVEGDKVTEAFAATVRTAVADYIVSLQGKVKPQELSRQMSNLDQTFVMIGPDGQPKPMLNIGSLIDDTLGFSEKSIGKEIYDRTVKQAITDIETQLGKQLEPAQKAKKQKELAVRLLENFSPSRVSMDDVGERLVSGGIDQLNTLKAQLKKAGNLTDEEVSSTLAAIYVDSLQNNAIKGTGKTIITDVKGTMIGESVIDVSMMRRMLGSDDQEKAKIVKDLIGERRYKVWDATMKLMSDRAADFRTKEFDITGVPRSFSVESFISRFYAINRGVISARYVGTEAVLQQFRGNKFNMIRSVLSDPELGELFLEMVRTGKPLTPQRETYFYNALVSSYAKFANEMGKPEPVTMEDKYGRAFTLYPDTTSGIPRTGRDALTGEGVRIPIFPEIEKQQTDFPIPSPFK
jgi:hypothetical protein